MDLKILATVFFTVFLSELGDKTQLATLVFAATSRQRLMVFLGSSAALMLSSGLAVILGDYLGKNLNMNLIKNLSGACFIMAGVWILLKGD